MNLDLAKKVADSVLYEGYLLYPYRASAVKNRQRFNFGVLLPPAYARAQTGHDAWSMRTECLLEGEAPRVDVRIRFLQVVVREAGRLLEPHETGRRETDPFEDSHQSHPYEIVSELVVNGNVYQTWQEAVEREVNLFDCSVAELLEEPQQVGWDSPPSDETEILRDAAGRSAGVLVRHRAQLDCSITVSVASLGERLWRITVEVENQTACDSPVTRDEALPHSLVAAHTLLTARDGQFVSLLDPPHAYVAHCAACRNVGTWPVLLGCEGEHEWMLSSPIILYDYPQIAPESAGSFFDGTEMDEMLALRVMTLTDDEKRQMRHVDQRAREILERTESLPQEHLLKLHGTIRGLKPAGSSETD